jgi:hypothetical protein
MRHIRPVQDVAAISICHSRIAKLSFVERFPRAVCAPVNGQTYRALKKYMHELSTDRDHAMCNIQNIPFQWFSLYNFEKLSMKTYQATGVLNS